MSPKNEKQIRHDQSIVDKTVELTSGKTYQVKFYLNRNLYQLFKEACAKKGRSAASIVEQTMLNTVIEEDLL